MKIKQTASFLALSSFLIASCSTGPVMQTPMEVERVPANVWSNCFESISLFFGKKPNSEEIFTNVAPSSRTAITEALAKKSIRYPNGFQDRQGMHIQYGFESEYLVDEAEVLLRSYMPMKPHFEGTKEQWLALTHQQRVKWINQRSDSIFPYRQKGQLKKITEDTELSSVLPESFVYDAGHYEIVLDPMDSAEELAKKIKVINAKLGVGSMQLTISNPIEKDLLKKSKELQAQMKQEILGYYNFMNEFDTLGKLASGHERYLSNPGTETIKSFNHPWLGPMTKLKHERLQSIMENVLAGKEYSSDELVKMSSQVVSHKFIGGLSFRPDVAFKKSRLASEVRDCHQNVKCIENRLIRETYFLMKGKADFVKFSQLLPFDSVATFDSLSSSIRTTLKTIFPKYGNYTQVELELYRNFAYPFRDWSKHIEILERPDLIDTIAAAQAEYKTALDSIAREFSEGKLTKAEARNRVMGALGEFSKKSGIAEAIKSQYELLVQPDEIKLYEHLRLAIWSLEKAQIRALAA